MKLPDFASSFIREALAAFDPLDPRCAKVLFAKLNEWRAADKSVQAAFLATIHAAQAACSHPDAQRGYNERDGNWMSACPICGATR